jgi:hypothetical protein
LRGRRHGQTRARGIDVHEIGDTRHFAPRERSEGQHRFDDAGCGDRMPDRPFEARDRWNRRPEDAANRHRFRSVGLRRPVGVRDDHPDLSSCDSRIFEGLPNRSRQPVAVVANVG